MSHVRKTKFTILALMLGTSLISGCGIQGDLYAPGTADNAVAAPQTAESSSQSASQAAPQSTDAESTDVEAADATEHAPVVE